MRNIQIFPLHNFVWSWYQSSNLWDSGSA